MKGVIHTLKPSQANPFGFTGEYTDPASDLTYLRARWYNAKEGTLVSRDPFNGNLTNPASLHPYQYAWNAPTMWTDPSGQNPCDSVPSQHKPKECQAAAGPPYNYCWYKTSQFYNTEDCNTYRQVYCKAVAPAPPVPAAPAPANTYVRIDGGYLEGLSVSGHVGFAGGNVGVEGVFDLWDFEAAGFYVENVGITVDQGSIAGFGGSFYVGFLWGWGNYKPNEQTVANYKGITVPSVALSIPWPQVPNVSAGAQYFRSQDDQLQGLEFSISLSATPKVGINLPIPKGSSVGATGGWGQLRTNVYRFKSGPTPDVWDGFEFTAFISSGGAFSGEFISPVGFIPVPTRAFAIALAMYNVDY